MTQSPQEHEIVRVIRPDAGSELVLVCEHASPYIPASLDGLGLAEADRLSHAAWDPGAFEVARRMAGILDAVLIVGGVSRLVYDCNRPPTAPDAMPAQSERVRIPGNADLDAAARADRARRYYEPFRRELERAVASRRAPVIVTVHSFTPVYNGVRREVEIGLLHDSDTRLVDAMLATARRDCDLNVVRNAPYGPQDGVTHTLKEHAIRNGHPNVMIEIRNDLVETEAQLGAVAELLSGWVRTALADLRGAAE